MKELLRVRFALVAILLSSCMAAQAATPQTLAIDLKEDQRFTWEFTSGTDPITNAPIPDTSQFPFRKDGGISGLTGGKISYTGPGLYFITAPSSATDIHKTITTTTATATTTTETFMGRLQLDGTFKFSIINDLTSSNYNIPDISPYGFSNLYVAVNLERYIAANPFGFNAGNWHQGDTLSNLGITIVNGQASGVDGIYWATSPWAFDPNPSGYGFTPVGGADSLFNSTGMESIVSMTSSVPEPESWALLLTSLGVVILRGRIFRTSV